MSVSSIGGPSTQYGAYNSQSAVHGVKNSESGDAKEPETVVTKVTTHCKKAHTKHDPSCESTVTTNSAPESGDTGKLVDKSV